MIVQTEQMCLGYRGMPVVEGVSFSLQAGQVCVVLGHNGAGKSTFVKTLLGLQSPLNGRFKWRNDKPAPMSYLGQRIEFDGQFPIRVKDLVTMGAWHGLGLLSRIDDEKSELVATALAKTKLTDMADRPIYECSAGQLQRCFFARAMVQNAPVLLLDEPFTAMDQATEALLVDLILSWRDEGRAIVMVLHDLTTARGLADTVLLLGEGRACFGPSADVLTAENLQAHGYLSELQAKWLVASEQAFANQGHSDV
ncbi:MAG: metal ABC transporter ATP-binding protein [Candidatus Puniceispirillaceae bacterium]